MWHAVCCLCCTATELDEAPLLGAAPPPEAEALVIEALDRAVRDAPGLSTAGAGCQLMRWGAAFLRPPGLKSQLRLCAAARIGFWGDAIAGPGFGRVEGGLRSAEVLVAQLLALLPGDRDPEVYYWFGRSRSRQSPLAAMIDPTRAWTIREGPAIRR